MNGGGSQTLFETLVGIFSDLANTFAGLVGLTPGQLGAGLVAAFVLLSTVTAALNMSGKTGFTLRDDDPASPSQ